MSHPLAWVSNAISWETLIESVGEWLLLLPAGPGRRPLPARLVLGLLYLKHAYDLFDEAVAHAGWRIRTTSISAAKCSYSPCCRAAHRQ